MIDQNVWEIPDMEFSFFPRYPFNSASLSFTHIWNSLAHLLQNGPCDRIIPRIWMKRESERESERVRDRRK